MADLTLPRGELKVLKAEDKDYDRGLLVELLDNGGYEMAYWYNKPNKPYPVEIIVDGESIKKDGKIVEMKFHPKDYYDKQEESKMGLKLEELVGKRLTEEQFDEAAGKKDACYHKVKARYDVWPSAYASGALVKCRKVGAANWGNKSKKESVNEAPKIDSRLHKGLKKIQDDSYKLLANYRTVPGIEKLVSAWMEGLHRSLNQLGIMKESVDQDVFFESTTEGNVTTTHIHWESNGKGHGYTVEYVNDGKLNEAEYQGRKVKLGKIMQGDTKKFKVYVKNPKGNVVKVNFGQGGSSASKTGGTMRIRKSNPKARANFRARHNCDNPGPRHKARYWSCRKW